MMCFPNELYNRKLDFLVKLSVLSGSLWRKSVMGIILSCVWGELLLLCVCIPHISLQKLLCVLCVSYPGPVGKMCFVYFVCLKSEWCDVFCINKKKMLSKWHALNSN